MSSALVVTGDPAELRRTAEALADLAARIVSERRRLLSTARSLGAQHAAIDALLLRASAELPSAVQQLHLAAELAVDVASGLERADSTAPQPGVVVDVDEVVQHLMRLGSGFLRVAPELAELARAVPQLAPVLHLLDGPLARVAPVAGVAMVAPNLLELILEGDPREAWRREGLDYAKRAAHVLSDSSLVGLAIAPSPLTLTASVATTVLWLNLESLDRGWPIFFPPLPPIEPHTISQQVQTLGEALDPMLDVALDRSRTALQAFGSHASEALTSLAEHDVIAAGGHAIDGMVELAGDGVDLLTDVGGAGLHILFGRD